MTDQLKRCVMLLFKCFEGFEGLNLPRRIAVVYKDLRNVMSKLHRSVGSTGFIKKALFNEVTPKFAQVRGNFINKNDKYKPERIILLSHLNYNVIGLKALVST